MYQCLNVPQITYTDLMLVRGSYQKYVGKCILQRNNVPIFIIPY